SDDGPLTDLRVVTPAEWTLDRRGYRDPSAALGGQPGTHLGSRRGSELGQDVFDVRFHGPRAYDQRVGDLLVGHSFGDQAGYLDFATGQGREVAGCSPLGVRQLGVAQRVIDRGG